MRRRKKTLHDRIFGNAKRIDGCLIWQGSPKTETNNPDSRYQCAIHAKGKTISVSRLAYMLANNLPFPGGLSRSQVVRHKCNRPRCVDPQHLIIGSAKDNTADMMLSSRHGMMQRWNVTPELIRDIRANVTLDDLSDVPRCAAAMLKYGLHASHLRNIVRRVSYDWLTD